MKKVRIICRSSRLSLLQAELVKQKIVSVQAGTDVEIIGRSSRGDRELNVDLSSLEGTDFFTEEIFRALERNEADIAVHSLKDMSADHFFSHTAFAVVDRDDVRDIAIFNPGILEKIRTGKTIVVGTCSPRRELMAVEFLKKALPQLHDEIRIETRAIRGNVEGRLKKLRDGSYDATILATAGLNRLLRSKTDAVTIRALLNDTRQMLLPLIECVPAPCQGAIVAEAHPGNKQAIELLEKINDTEIFNDVYQEKQDAYQYGTGCLQRFGVTTIETAYTKTRYAAGTDNKENNFSKWCSLPAFDQEGKNIFSTTDHMKDFFKYQWDDGKMEIKQPVVFVANYKAIQYEPASNALAGKTIYASGTKTWLELAKQGLWVSGAADAMGFEWFSKALLMPLLNIQQEDIFILTHKEAAKRWKEKGYQSAGNYTLLSTGDANIAAGIAAADMIFWTSFSQYQHYGTNCKQNVQHSCAGGETAFLLQKAGVEPLVFPTIKSFEQWRNYSTRPLSVA